MVPENKSNWPIFCTYHGLDPNPSEIVGARIFLAWKLFLKPNVNHYKSEFLLHTLQKYLC